jgi:hypothetical protein
VPGEPGEEALQSGQCGIQGCLTQRLAASATLIGKVSLERPRLLDMKRLEVPVAGVDFEPVDRLRHGVNRLLAVALSLGPIGEVLALDSLVCGVVVRHRWLPSVESQFTLGLTVSSMRGRACVIVTSRLPRTASSFCGLTRR